MAQLDPKEAFENFQRRALQGIKEQFPIDGRNQIIDLEKIEVRDKLDPDDIRSQHQAKIDGKSWSVPVYAEIAIKDKSSGKVLDKKTVRVADIPKMTKRYSYILDGQEYQVDNQWQLKPGAYVRRRQSGELETRFNVAGKSSFDLTFDDATKQFRMEYGKAKLPLYPLVKALGVTDSELEKTWGKEILEANKSVKKTDSALEQFYKSSKKTTPTSREEAEAHLRDVMSASRLREDSTEKTLGKPFQSVTGEALTLATNKMLKVQSGAPEDDRDDLEFKLLRDVGDFAYDKLKSYKPTIRTKLSRKVNHVDQVNKIDWYGILNHPIKETFHRNSAANSAKQINPIEMMASSQQTTIMGPGGIQSENTLMNESKFINPSHLGYLDPVHTPESSKAGVTLRLPLGVKKVDQEPRIPLYNIKKGKFEYVGPSQFKKAKVVLPDQVVWEGNTPKPIANTVKVSDVGNEIRETSFKDADYAIRHSSQLFNATANLIPFMGNDSGGRVTMASRHIEQAISLKDRQAPLVQVKTPSDIEGSKTFEELLGRQAAHTTPVGGVVEAIKNDAVVIKTDDGKKREVQIYRNYPLNDSKSVLDSTPRVKVGDKVKAGDVVADTNFSKDGQLALGNNLRVAYLPFKGLNYEDGIVVSKSAADKLSSVHLNKYNLPVDSNTVLGKSSYLHQHHGNYDKDQLAKIDDDGVVRVGQKVRPGDPLVLAMKKVNVTDKSGLAAIRKNLAGQHTDKSLVWEGETAGEVVGVVRRGSEIDVHVKTVEPLQIGDKITSRHGAKGIVVRVIPDEQMPHTKDGKPIEVALNPTGVGGRMNVGQILETAAGKIAEKTGKPYVVENFQPFVDWSAKIKGDLKKHGIEDTEELIDPTTKMTLGKALVGPQHILKLHLQVDKKISARSGLDLPGQEPHRYNMNLQPSGGGSAGGQAVDHLGLYSLLSHGAKANIREMMTFKSEGPNVSTVPGKGWGESQHRDVWEAIQYGDPLPVPKPTFAFHKFTELLKGAGINVEKKGHEFVLSPITDKHIEQMTGKNVLTKPSEIVYSKLEKSGDPKPKTGGLFDEKITGGHGGRKWSRIELAEPLPNPVFEKPIKVLTGLEGQSFDAVVSGEKAIDKDGKLVDPGKGLTGGEAIKSLLDKIDVQKELEKAKKDLSKAPAYKVDPILKKVKYLEVLNAQGLKPSEAYVLHKIPVLPPIIRPVAVLQDGNIKHNDINELYSSFAQVNDKLKDPILVKNLTESGKSELRKNYYQGVKALMGVGIPYKDAEHKGLIHQIEGSKPKSGYFQSVLTSRKQDLSMRSTIVPEPAMGLDEIGLPKDHTMKLMAPFVVNKLTYMGVSSDPLEAQKEVAKGSKIAFKALEKVLEERPVIVKRDPALHKYSVQAFKPRLVQDHAIHIHPLVTSGFGADFDGDQMSVFVPVSEEARKEAFDMMPSRNLFSEATGRVMYQPTLEAALGLHKLTRVNGQEPVKTFKHPADAIEAVRNGKLTVNDPVKVGDQKTTAGRILVSMALPEKLQPKVMTDFSIELDTKGINKILTQVAKEHKDEFGAVANKLKDIGNGAAYGLVPVEHKDYVGTNRLDANKAVFVPVGTSTLSLDDILPDKKTRSPILSAAQKNAQKIQNSSLSKQEKDRKLVELWTKTDKHLLNEHLKKADEKPDNLYLMYKAGIKPGPDQYKQIKLAPMVLKDGSGKDLPTPVTRSYSEGLDVGGFWTQMSGARRGAIMKVQEVQEPGYLSKLLMSTTMDMVVTGDDCGTQKGVSIPLSSPDVNDRYLMKPFKAKGFEVQEGTILTPDLVGKMLAADKNAKVVVRSPLKCEHGKGICQKCMGISASGQDFRIGDNVGVSSAQALGERAVQLTMKVTHSGGVASGDSQVIGSFDRIQQLTMLPKKIPNATTLSMKSGVVEKVEKDQTGVKVWVGGKAHHIGKDSSGRPLYETIKGSKVAWAPPKPGMKIEKGQPLSDPSRTFINPHDLYKATGDIEKVQNFLVDELHGIYSSQGIRRQAVETVVKAMSNLTKVQDPGDADGILRGEFQPSSKILSLNKELMKSGKRPVEHAPVIKGVDVLPLSLQEDWIAKLQHQRVKSTILDAAATGGKSNIHGTHPIPGLAYGAEFGATSKDVKGKPWLAHLADIPIYSY